MRKFIIALAMLSITAATLPALAGYKGPPPPGTTQTDKRFD